MCVNFFSFFHCYFNLCKYLNKNKTKSKKMGIDKFFPYIKSKSDNLYKDVYLKDLKGKTLVFDTNGVMYAYKFGQDNLSQVLRNMIELVIDLEVNEITPIFVFDGMPPEQKKDEVIKRSKEKQKHLAEIKDKKLQLDSLIERINLEKINASVDVIKSLDEQIEKAEIDFKKFSTSKVYLGEEDKNNIWAILHNCGYLCIRAHNEGEALCAMLARLKIADIVVSKDSDTVVCNAPYLLSNLQGKTKRETTPMMLFDQSKIYDAFEVKQQEELIEICCLPKNDFNKYCRLEGISMIKAVETIKKHGTIESFIISQLLYGKDDGKSNNKRKRKPKKTLVIPENYDPNFIRHQFYFASFGFLPSYCFDKINEYKKLTNNEKKQMLMNVIEQHSDDEEKWLYVSLCKLWECRYKTTKPCFNDIDVNFDSTKYLDTQMPKEGKLTFEEKEEYEKLINERIMKFRTSKEDVSTTKAYTEYLRIKLTMHSSSSSNMSTHSLDSVDLTTIDFSTIDKTEIDIQPIKMQKSLESKKPIIFQSEENSDTEDESEKIKDDLKSHDVLCEFINAKEIDTELENIWQEKDEKKDD